MISRLVPIRELQPGDKVVHWRGNNQFVVESIKPHSDRRLTFLVSTTDGRSLSVSAFSHLNVVDPENT